MAQIADTHFNIDLLMWNLTICAVLNEKLFDFINFHQPREA